MARVYRTVFGTYLHPDGTPKSGYLEFTPTHELVERPGARITADTIRVPLDATGSFSVSLITTDNASIDPTGWLWSIEEKIPNGTIWYFEVLTGVTPLDLSDVYVINGNGGPFYTTQNGLGSPGWDDLRVSIITAKTDSNNPTLATFRNGLQAYSFSASQVNEVFFDVQLPHNWIQGSEIRPHVHWSPGNNTDTGNVRWNLEYSWANPVQGPDDTFPATVINGADQASSGVAYSHRITDLGHIDGTGKRISSVLMCRLARLGNDVADTFAGACFGLSVDFHIQIAGNGSVDEYPAV